MFETMREAEGVGLAGPQVGLEERIFVMDLSPLATEEYPSSSFTKVFINAGSERRGDLEAMEEGVSASRGYTRRSPGRMRFESTTWMRTWYLRDEVYTGYGTGYPARVRSPGWILFIDKISPLRKRMVKSKLANMEKGKVACAYKIRTAR